MRFVKDREFMRIFGEFCLSRDWFSTNRRSIRHRRSSASGRSNSKRSISEVTRSLGECGKITTPRSVICLVLVHGCFDFFSPRTLCVISQI